MKTLIERYLQVYQEKGYDQLPTFIDAQTKQHICKKADELLLNIIRFDKPWDMERCIVPTLFDMKDFNYVPYEDEEWCFMLNRMEFIKDLVMAGMLTNDKRYFLKTKEWIVSWIQEHPTIEYSLSTRTLDTGIRILSMVETLPILCHYNILNESECLTIVESIRAQVNYLKQSYIPKYALSNWGSIQTCAILCTLPYIYEDYKTCDVYVWAMEEVVQQFAIQIYEDGMLWEQSTMYHVEVLQYGMKLLHASSMFHFTLDASIKSMLHNMAIALAHLTTPSLEIEAFGDSDVVGTQDILYCASLLFEDSSVMVSSTYDADCIYSYGCNFLHSHQEKKRTILHKTYDGMDSGIYTIRSSWEKNASYTMFLNGSLGSGHGHSDNLHLSIYHKGSPMFIDSGRYTYREDDIRRVDLKRMMAHNTLIVDRYEPCLPNGSWTYERFATPTKNYVHHFNHMHYLEGSLLYENGSWTRKVVVIDPNIWMIIDEVRQKGTHDVKTYYHIDPSISLQKTSQAIVVGELQVQRNEPYTIQSMSMSKLYNEVVQHDVLVYEASFQDQYQSCTCMADISISIQDVDILQDMKECVSSDIACAKKFQVSEDESYTIVIFHKEVYKGKKVFSIEGICFHAKCVILHEKEGVKQLYRLKT